MKTIEISFIAIILAISVLIACFGVSIETASPIEEIGVVTEVIAEDVFNDRCTVQFDGSGGIYFAYGLFEFLKVRGHRVRVVYKTTWDDVGKKPLRLEDLDTGKVWKWGMFP